MKTRTTVIISSLIALLLLVGPARAQEDTVLPSAWITSPSSVVNQQQAVALPYSPTFRFQGICGREGEFVTHFRTLLKPALLPSDTYADTRYDFWYESDTLVPFDDPAWSEWQPFDAGENEASVTYADLPASEPDPWDPDSERRIYYTFAVQVLTSDGAVSLDRAYGQNVANFCVSDGFAPQLDVYHTLLGGASGSGPYMMRAFDILGDLDGVFTWTADAERYGGEIASYRWGWDVLDADDPDDPGWALPAGLDDEHRTTGPVPAFAGGVHTLTIRVLDTNDAVTQIIYLLTYVPIPDPADQYPLLLVDDVNDRNTNAWPDPTYTPLDRDEFRDAFWDGVLTGPGGIAGFDPARDVIDTEDQEIEARDLVDYRAVLWTSRWVSAPNSATSRLRPYVSGYQVLPRYDWLSAYQDNVGNLLACGRQTATNFLPESPYMLPIVFESMDGDHNGMTWIDDQPVRVGFGTNAEDNPIYPALHPYRDFGLAAVDIVSPTLPYVDVDGESMRLQRRSGCVGMKGLVLDAGFAAANMPGGAAFPDTIWTEETIDWQDQDGAWADDLTSSYVWSNDEFYNVDVAGRDTPFTIQQCDDGPCVEPMLRSISRFDWNRQRHFDTDPGDEWPQDYYPVGEIDAGCGDLALNPDRTGTHTNNQTTAFVTHKHLDSKPSGRGDVVMGFDPYRFDHEAMKNVLRWVLGEHFGLTMSP